MIDKWYVFNPFNLKLDTESWMPAARCESQAHGDTTFPQSNSMLWNGLGIQKIKLWNAQNICHTPFPGKISCGWDTHTHTLAQSSISLGAQNLAKIAGCCTLFVTTLENTSVTCQRKNLAVILVCLKIGQGPRIQWWIMFPSRWLVGWGIGLPHFQAQPYSWNLRSFKGCLHHIFWGIHWSHNDGKLLNAERGRGQIQTLHSRVLALIWCIMESSAI